MSSVLVTGAARGIGHCVATDLAAKGWDVIAGVRTEQDAARLKAAHHRISPIILDVTNADDVAALDTSLPQRLDAVVNNAGIVVGGPMEAVTPDDLRRQLDVNVIGQLTVTQAVLPRLRRCHGRIVFMSSLNGKVTSPLMGAYCASKFALEATADALRLELKPWGIPVVIIEPPQTDTDLWRTVDTEFEATRPPRCPTSNGICTTATSPALRSRFRCRRESPSRRKRWQPSWKRR